VSPGQIFGQHRLRTQQAKEQSHDRVKQPRQLGKNRPHVLAAMTVINRVDSQEFGQFAGGVGGHLVCQHAVQVVTKSLEMFPAPARSGLRIAAGDKRPEPIGRFALEIVLGATAIRAAAGDFACARVVRPPVIVGTRIARIGNTDKIFSGKQLCTNTSAFSVPSRLRLVTARITCGSDGAC
jgi:hypothetical protein